MNGFKKIVGIILILCTMISSMTSCANLHKKYANSMVLDFHDVVLGYDSYDALNGANKVSWMQFETSMNHLRTRGYNCELYGYRYVPLEITRKYVDTLGDAGFEFSECVTAGCPSSIAKSNGYKLKSILSQAGFDRGEATCNQLYHSEDSLWLCKEKGKKTDYVIIFSGQLQGEEDVLFILVIS